MVALTSLGPMDDYPTIPAGDVRPGMTVRIGSMVFEISHAYRLSNSGNYIFGYEFYMDYDQGCWVPVRNGDSFNGTVRSTRSFDANERIELVFE